jgi:hypothetical protein
MRTSLTGLATRVDRLINRIEVENVGCDICREDERCIRFASDGLPADAPLSNQCSGCGRSYELSWVTWLPAEPKRPT